MDTAVKARWGLVVTAVLFSTGGAAIKSCGLAPVQVACGRSFIAALLLLAVLPETRRRPTLGTLLVGCAQAATMVSFVFSNKLTTAANATFLQSTAPLWLLILGPVFLRERAGRGELVACAIMAAGLVAMLLGDDASSAVASDPLLGNAVAIASGLFWALTLVGMRSVGRAGSGTASAAAVIGNVLAAAVTVPLVLPVVAPSAADLLTVTFLGVFQVGAAYAVLARSLPHVRALDASLLLLLESVLGPIWALLLHGEQPTATSAAGAGLVLVAALLRTRRVAG
jgi:drug/metabolite transporter (DMT)-like permease